MSGRWYGYTPPPLAPTPPRTKSRGWTIAGLLLAAAGIGYVVLRPRVHTTPEGNHVIGVTPLVRGEPRAVAIVAPLPGGRSGAT